ncbi:dUTP diphosphatase (plasmid) [Rhizobium leguminosarum]|uniref:dUTP diphosphatase n=1 Tax=Rhizobium leguminosarum TaxID=384 RepID=UPI00035E148F|nr:dUTP diphosphatase [Rhizobium leguminosarum]MBY5468282.1 dUTP diphosphatase [Rhizobium leguminosarum]MBY5530930.1 dUTP diphosphatase [Rhizobium leguminosarum]MBY5905666.1 dUTP diphosphatase [Rhizobium leguminosarum]MBY5912705.1 dUTP diphosphatase [Rhizobium leguminosarum]NKK02061.1 dUTP diphosphatase [Rhizobium leguminosarum bv. viciae]
MCGDFRPEKSTPDRSRVKVLLLTDRARLPEYQTSGPAGADVFAAFDGPAIELAPGTGEVSTTGIALELPLGGEAQIRSRSGLPAEHGIIVLNSPGTIDSDYRGELKVILFNTSNAPFSGSGDRIAQLVIAPFVQAEFQSLPEISEAPRGGRGLGSTGIMISLSMAPMIAFGGGLTG